MDMIERIMGGGLITLLAGMFTWQRAANGKAIDGKVDKAICQLHHEQLTRAVEDIKESQKSTAGHIEEIKLSLAREGFGSD